MAPSRGKTDADSVFAFVVVNVTSLDGVLHGQLKLTLDDLRHPSWLGEQIVDALPGDLRAEVRREG